LSIFACVFPFASYLHKIESKAVKTPLTGENISIQKPTPDFPLIVCWRFLPISYRFSINSSILTSYQWPFDIFHQSLTVSELFALTWFSSNKEAPSKQIIAIKSSIPTSY
jgi:hypothetical protein